MTRPRTLLMIAYPANPDLLRTPGELGLQVVLASARAPEDPSVCDVHLPVSERDEAAVTSAVDAYLEAGGRIDAVACFHEGSLHVAASLAARLGVPGNSPECVSAIRDKHRCAHVLASAGVRVPRTFVANSLEEARAAACELGYPLVVKPQASASSQGVIKVCSDRELEDAFAMVRGLYDVDAFTAGRYSVPNVARIYLFPGLYGVLLQEYVAGPEVAVDLVYGAGVFRLLAIHEKPEPFAEPYFIERTYVTPPALPEATQRELVERSVAALRALGATAGGAHIEFRITEMGPTVIEVNGRLGGTTAYVQESIRESTGVWGPREYLRAVLGEEPAGPTGSPRPAGFTALLADQTGEIAGFEGEEQVRRIPGVLGVRWMARPGDHIVIQYPANPVSCFALVLARGDSREDVLRALHEAETTLRPRFAAEASCVQAS